MNDTIVIIAVSFVGIMTFGVILSLYFSNRDKERQQRMAVITGHASPQGGVGPKDKAKERANRTADIAKKLKEASEDKKRKNKDKDKKSLKDLIRQAGFGFSVLQFWLGSFVFAGLVFMLLSMTSLGGLAKSLMLFIAFFGLPRMFLKFKFNRRQKKFMEDFADGLDAMVRLLQAGMPVSEAVAMIAREYEGPLREEMEMIYEDQKVGISLGEAAHRCSQRLPITEVQMFATALQIQSETGSSLSEVLTNLSAVIRARFRLSRKVKALSSEAKASAGIIGALPILVAGGLYLVNPDYISLLFTVPKGKVMVAGAIIWMSFGVIMMKQMINFKV